MKLMVCIDKTNGVMFGGRRISQDSVLREKILEICKGSKLWMNSYSSKQFEDCTGISVSEDFLNLAGENDFCFIENTEFPVEKAESVYLFNWNRKYQADFFFPVDSLEQGFKRISRENFAGSSHDRITLDIYGRKQQ